MKKIFFSILLILIIPITCLSQIRDSHYYPNNVKYNLIFSDACFYKLNNKTVHFSGLSFGRFSDFTKKLPLYLGVNCYFPKEYNGQILLNATQDTASVKELLVDAKLKGSILSFDLNLLIKLRGLSYISKSEDYSVIPMLGITGLYHKPNFEVVDIDRLAYFAPKNQSISIASLSVGIYSRFRIGCFPLCFQISHTINLIQKNYYISELKKSYSSYLKFGLGLTLPLIQGQGISNIKTIHY